MKLSKYLPINCVNIDASIMKAPTSYILCNSLFFHIKENGLPYILPVMRLILKKLIDIINKMCLKYDVMPIEIPLLAKNELLFSGQPVGDIFKSKTIFLDGLLSEYHLLTTPEISIINFVDKENLSYRNMPYSFAYIEDYIRKIKDTKNILKTRQIKSLAITSVNKDFDTMIESLHLCELISDELFTMLNVQNIIKRHNYNGILFEHFYLCDEGYNFHIPEYDTNRRVKALDLTMGYHYIPQKNRIKFLSQNGEYQPAFIGSYGIGLTRLIYIIFDSIRNERGFSIPKCIRPFDIFLCGTSGSSDILDKIYSELSHKYAILYDDRRSHKKSNLINYDSFLNIFVTLNCIGDEIHVTLNDNLNSKSIFNNVQQVINYINSLNLKA